jgi:hypothetical protein
MLLVGIFFCNMKRHGVPLAVAIMKLPDFQSGRNAPSSGVPVGQGYAPE